MLHMKRNKRCWFAIELFSVKKSHSPNGFWIIDPAPIRLGCLYSLMAKQRLGDGLNGQVNMTGEGGWVLPRIVHRERRLYLTSSELEQMLLANQSPIGTCQIALTRPDQVKGCRPKTLQFCYDTKTVFGKIIKVKTCPIGYSGEFIINEPVFSFIWHYAKNMNH